MANLEDMRIFARCAEAGGFTAGARLLGMPKQTVSRRVGALEADLGVQLLHRSTRRFRLTEAGAAYSARCQEVVRLAEEATHYLQTAVESPAGILRVTADRFFGETFLSPLLCRYARRYPEAEIEVVLTPRLVDLVEEGFDVAFRVGPAGECPVLGEARIRYCASPEYLQRRGVPTRPTDLGAHECLIYTHDRWPFRDGPRAVSGRLRFNSFPMVRDAALAGLGIGVFPEFACALEINEGRLAPVLEEWTPPVGSVFLAYPPQRFMVSRVRAFIEFVREEFATPPWVIPPPPPGRPRPPSPSSG